MGDADTGPNQLQNFPVITSVMDLGGGQAQVEGTINAQALADYRIE